MVLVLIFLRDGLACCDCCNQALPPTSRRISHRTRTLLRRDHRLPGLLQLWTHRTPAVASLHEQRIVFCRLRSLPCHLRGKASSVQTVKSFRVELQSAAILRQRVRRTLHFQQQVGQHLARRHRGLLFSNAIFVVSHFLQGYNRLVILTFGVPHPGGRFLLQHVDPVRVVVVLVHRAAFADGLDLGEILLRRRQVSAARV